MFSSLNEAVHDSPVADAAPMTALFDEQLAAGELEEAEKTLALLQLQFPGPRTAVAEVRFHCRSDSKADALIGLRKLCTVSERETAALNQAAQAVSDAGWGRDSEYVFREALSNRKANIEVAGWWVRSFVGREAWDNRKRLHTLDPDSVMGRRARFVYLAELGRLRNFRLLKRFVLRESESLAKDTPSWGQLGYAWNACEEHRAVVAWMADWRTRKGLEPWMLRHYAASLRWLGRDREAAEVNEFAVQLPRDHTSDYHRLWLACDAALNGDVAQAKEHLSKVGCDRLEKYDRGLLAIVTAKLEMNAAPGPEQKRVFGEQRKVLSKHRFRERAINRASRRALKQMANLADLPLAPYLGWWPPRLFWVFGQALELSLSWIAAIGAAAVLLILCAWGAHSMERSIFANSRFETLKPAPSEKMRAAVEATLLKGSTGPNRLDMPVKLELKTAQQSRKRLFFEGTSKN